MPILMLTSIVFLWFSGFTQIVDFIKLNKLQKHFVYLDDSSTTHGSKEGGDVMGEKTDLYSSATLNPDPNLTQGAHDPSELKLMTSQQISRPSKKVLKH